MKRIFAIIFTMLAFTTLVGCSSNTEPLPDQRLITMFDVTSSPYGTTDNPYLDGTRSFEVTEQITEKGNSFCANLDGENTQKFIFGTNDESEPDYFDLSKAKSVENKQVMKLYNNSKSKVISYISTSELLDDKEGIINFLNNIPVLAVEFNGINGVGAFYDEYETIFINSKEYNHVCDWLFVHELIHAISYYTHGCTSEYDYSYSVFCETMTDLITFSINYNSPEVSNSSYSVNYNLVLPFIGIFKEDAISGYFYGYQNIINKIENPAEMNLWVNTLNNLYGIGIVRTPTEKDEPLLFAYYNITYKWAAL